MKTKPRYRYAIDCIVPRKANLTLFQPNASIFFHLFGVLRRFQHCTGHITMGSWKGRGNQYIEFARVLYCKLPTNGKQLPAFPHRALTGIEPRPQRWEARVLPLCHRGPPNASKFNISHYPYNKCNELLTPI